MKSNFHQGTQQKQINYLFKLCGLSTLGAQLVRTGLTVLCFIGGLQEQTALSKITKLIFLPKL